MMPSAKDKVAESNAGLAVYNSLNVTFKDLHNEPEKKEMVTE